MRGFFRLTITLKTIFLMQVLLLLLIGAGVWSVYSIYMSKYHKPYATLQIECTKPSISI